MKISNKIDDAIMLLNTHNIINDRIIFILIQNTEISKLSKIILKYLEIKVKLDNLKIKLINEGEHKLVERINQCYRNFDKMKNSKFDKQIFELLIKSESYSIEQVFSILKVDSDKFAFLKFEDIFGKKLIHKRTKKKKNKIKYKPSFEDSWKTNNSVHTIYTNPSRY